jgi:autotransporter translocation and assembly factor TamB
MARRIFIGTGIALLVTLVAVSAVGFATLTGRLPDLARALARGALELALASPVELEAVEGSLLGRFRLRGLVIGAADHSPLRVESIEVSLALDELLHQRIAMEHTVITNLAITMIVDSDGVQVLGLAPNDETQSADDADQQSAWKFELASASLRGARIHVLGEGEERGIAALDAELEGLRLPVVEGAGGWPERMSGSLRIETAGVGSRSIDSGLLQLEARGPDFEVALRDFALGKARIEGDVVARLAGRLDSPSLGTLEAALRFSGLDLALLLGDAAPTSNLDGHVEGRLEDETWHAEIQLGASELAGWPIESARALGHVARDGDQVEIEEARIVAEGARLRGSGSISPDALHDFEVSELEVELASLPPAFRPAGATRGRVSGHGRASGAWDDLVGEITLQAMGLELSTSDRSAIFDAGATLHLLGGERYRIEELSFATQDEPRIEIASAEPIELRCIACLGGGAAAPELEVERATLATMGGSLRLAGHLDFERLDELRLEAEGIRVAELTGLVASLRGATLESGPDLGGSLSGALRFDGPVDATRIDGELLWTTPRIAQTTAEHIQLQLQSSEGPSPSLSATATLRRRGSDALVVYATTPARHLLLDPAALLREPDLHAKAEARGVEVEWITTLFPAEWRDLRGQLQAHLEIDGPLVAPALRGEFALDSPRRGDLGADRIDLRFGSAGPDQPLRVTASLDVGARTMLRVDATLANRTHLASPRQLLRDPDAHATITADDLDLRWLSSLAGTESLQIEGRANGPLELRGGTPEPQATGELTLSQVHVAGAPLPGPIGPISGRLRFDGSRVRVGPIELTSGDGAATLEGDIELSEPPQVDMQLQLEHVELDQPGVLAGAVEGRLRVSGPLESLRARGSASLHDAEIHMPDSGDPVMKEIRVRELSQADGPASIFEASGERDPLERLQIELDFELGEDVWLRAHGANLRLAGVLKVRKPSGQPPALFGSVEVEEGRYDLNGRVLNIERGSAHFVGDPAPDPQIEVTALHRVRDVIITVRIYGRASDLRVELQSDPPMSEQNMLSYLYFNRPMEDLDEERQQAVGISASVMAAGMILGPMGTQLGEAVGLSRIGVTMDDDQPAIELERQIGNRLRVLYNHSFGDRGGERIVVEYRLFRRLFISGETRTSGESGVDLLWSHDY